MGGAENSKNHKNFEGSRAREGKHGRGHPTAGRRDPEGALAAGLPGRSGPAAAGSSRFHRSHGGTRAVVSHYEDAAAEVKAPFLHRNL